MIPTALAAGIPVRLRRPLMLLVAALALALVMLAFSPVDAAHAACKPPGVPQMPGSGAAGFLDPATAEPSETTIYGQYGWAGLKWYNCELGGPIAGNEWAGDPVAGIDTLIGNFLIGAAAFLASLMTALHKWNADPSGLLEPIDSLLVGLSDMTREIVFDNWIVAVMALGGLAILVAALTRQVRKTAYTCLATLGAFAFMAFIGTYPVQIAQGVDGVASSVINTADQRSLEEAGISAPPDEAMGAILNDRLLWPLWARGQTNNPDQSTVQPTDDENDFTNQFFKASAMRWSEVESENPDRMRDRYNDIYQAVKDSSKNSGMTQTVKGQSYNRTAMGFVAAAEMVLVAAIRVPAEALVLGGVILFRFIPIIGPVFAILAILEQTRSATMFGLKAVFASVYNVVLYGIIAAIHTALLAYMVNNADLGFTLIISVILTYVFWKLAKPFRSLTKPATGDEIARAGEDAASGLTRSPADHALRLWALANGAKAVAGRGGGEAPQPQPQQEPASSAGQVYNHQQVLVMAGSDFVRPHPGPTPRAAYQWPETAGSIPATPAPAALPAGPAATAGTAAPASEVVPERGPIVVHPDQSRQVVPERGPIVVHPDQSRQAPTTGQPGEVSVDGRSLRADDRSEARATAHALAPLLQRQQAEQANHVPNAEIVNNVEHSHQEAVLFSPQHHISQTSYTELEKRYFIPPTMRPENTDQPAELFIPGDTQED